METIELAAFLKTALKLQMAPFSGIRAVNNMLLATDGCQMVVYKPGRELVQGEGVIEPVNARALLAYAEETHVAQIRVTGNVVEFDVVFASADAPSGYTRKRDTVRLAAFDARVMRLETILPNFTPPLARLVAAELYPRRLQKSVASKERVVFDEQTASFREATDDDILRYSARQVRGALALLHPLFVNVRIGAKNELVLETADLLYAVTPFVRKEQTA